MVFLPGFCSAAMGSMSLEQMLVYLRGEFGDARGVRFRVFVVGQPKDLKPSIKEKIYLIAREALINSLRHSKATSIEAEVEYRPRRLGIFVRDNGCGIDPKTVQSGRDAVCGLIRMRDCATGIGAQLQIWSRPGTGTEVKISLSGRRLVEVYL
jgi:signal transduction histidine kinase